MALEVVSANPRRRRIRLLANPVTVANPRRRRRSKKRGYRRNPDGTFAANPTTVALLNPRRRKLRLFNPTSATLANPRKRRARRNPIVAKNPLARDIMQGVGFEEIAGGVVGAFAAQEVPALLKMDTVDKITQTNADGTTTEIQVASYQNILASAGGAIAGGIGAGLVSKRAAAGAVIVGMAVATLKLIGKVSGGRWGMLAGSPAMHLVTSAKTRQAVTAPTPLRALPSVRVPATDGRADVVRSGV